MRTQFWLGCAAGAFAAWAAAAVPAAAQAPPEPIEETVVGHVLHPAGLDPTPDRIATLKMPRGFHIEKFAEGLENPRMLLVSPDGTVYVSQRKTKNVVMLKSLSGSRVADVQMEVAKGPHMPRSGPARQRHVSGGRSRRLDSGCPARRHIGGENADYQ